MRPDASHPGYLLPVRACTQRDPRTNYSARENCFFVTFCTLRAYPWLRPDSRAADLVTVLCAKQRRIGFEMLRFTIMWDHWHGFIRPSGRGEDLSQIVEEVKVKFNEVRYAKGDRHRFWQRGFHDHRVRDMEDYEALDAYIVWNAVQAGYVDAPEKHTWCGSIVNGIFRPLAREQRDARGEFARLPFWGVARAGTATRQRQEPAPG